MPIWVVQVLIAIAMALLSYAFMPRPKAPKPDTSQELEAPVAEAGAPINVVFGTITVQSPNALWSGDASTTIQKVKM